MINWTDDERSLIGYQSAWQKAANLIDGTCFKPQLFVEGRFVSRFFTGVNWLFRLRSFIMRNRLYGFVLLTLLMTSTVVHADIPAGTNIPDQSKKNVTGQAPELPLRAIFYYPWFPNAWTQKGIYPYTHYSPSLGFYDSGNETIIQQHIAAMQYGRIEAGILSWWGQGHYTDGRVGTILAATAGHNFHWAIYHEGEGQGNPTVNEITADLIYLRDQYSQDPAFLKINGRFVVFVYADAADGCDMATRWAQANSIEINAYIVLKVFPGYKTCSDQPQNWHQYSPAKAVDQQIGYSYTISPGFWKVGETPRLERDLARWNQNIRDMVASGEPLQLITTFNEWGEGSSVESTVEWSSGSGYGDFLDALHNDGVVPFSKMYLPFIRTGGTSSAPSDPVLVGAGDIADCDTQDDEATAALLAAIPGTVFTTGDNVYDYGTDEEFANCYQPSWGMVKGRTFPSVGNHEYRTAGAGPYFAYFGAAAGKSGEGYYSYNLGAWHIIVLNSNCVEIGGCQAGSPQEQWLRQDLAANPTLCTLAYWHHPRFNSGNHGNHPAMEDFWQALYDYGAEVVLNGHAHSYERFAPQDPNGVADPMNGVLEFVVGTGGKNHTPLGEIQPNSEVANADTFGVLKLILHPTSFEWEFIPVAGKTFTDSGNRSCR